MDGGNLEGEEEEEEEEEAAARCHSGQDHFREKGSIPEVLDSAVQAEDPPSPVPKKAAP